jgi:hypothetical protein
MFFAFFFVSSPNLPCVFKIVYEFQIMISEEEEGRRRR